MSAKEQLITEIITKLKAEIATIEAAALAAHHAATHEESKAEDQYDTRGLEASYLAGAQAARAQELRQTCAIYQKLAVRTFAASEPIGPGAWVELELGSRRMNYFLVNQGGGLSVQVDGKNVNVITLQAPLGEALEGKRLGDTVEVEAQNGIREYRITGVV